MESNDKKTKITEKLKQINKTVDVIFSEIHEHKKSDFYYDLCKSYIIDLYKLVSEEPHKPEYVQEQKNIIDYKQFTESKEISEIIPPVGKSSEDKKEQLSESAVTQKQTVSDRFQKSSKTLIDKFSDETEDRSVGTRLKTTPIKELHKSIGINDRFNFISELFNGDKTQYEQYINDICSLSSEQEIMHRLSTTADEKKWEAKPSYSKFREYIQRYSLSK